MTLTVTATSAGQLVSLTVTSSPAILGDLNVYRVHPDGKRFRVISDSGNILAGTWLGRDFHSPFNERVTYVAEAGGQVSAPSASTRIASKVNWIMHPTDHDLSMPVKLVGPPADTDSDVSVQRFDLIGQKLPVHQPYGPSGGKSSALSVMAETPKEIAALEALFEDGGQLLLNTVWRNDMAWMWVQRGKLNRKVMGRADQNIRVYTFPYDETTPPDVDADSELTIGELTATGLTIGQVSTTFTSIANLTYNVRI